MSQPVQPVGAFASPGDALAAVEAGLAFLVRTDAASVPGRVMADWLRRLEAVQSVQVAARSRILAAFDGQSVYEDDGSRSAASWLAWQARTTRRAAGIAEWWTKRLADHPRVAAALTAGRLSESYARQLFGMSDRLPEGKRDGADEILLAAHAGGADLGDLAALLEEMLARCAPPDTDQDGDPGFTDRSVKLDLHYKGAGQLAGDLTPECAAALTALLDSLGKRAGPADDRSRVQRNHDALEEGLRRLVGSGSLPDVAAQPATVLLHMDLDQLLPLPGAADAAAAWAAGADGAAGAWAAGRAAADGQPGWASSRQAAQAYACDARIQPIVTGHVDPAALAAMTGSYLSYPGRDGCTCGKCTCARPGFGGPGRPLSPRSMRRLQDTLLRYAAEVLSGPAGLASFLRTGLLAGQFPVSVSLPLDVGKVTHTVPPHLRRAVITRDRHCATPGCTTAAQYCQVHHIKPRSEGGTTSLSNLVLLCPFHHLIAIHRWGWAIALNGDGTTTFTSPDGKRVLRGHGPP
jgi:hypothetical protein